MKRILPMAFKYLAIVAVSCLLAVSISHGLAVAQDAESSTRVVRADENFAFATSGINRVETSPAMWRDGSRARDVPVKGRTQVPGVSWNGAALRRLSAAQIFSTNSNLWKREC